MTMGTSLARWPRSPWFLLAAALVGVALAVAFAPLASVVIVVGLALGSFLVSRFGLVYGAWYLVLLTIPLREPLSFDVRGTVSFCPMDVVTLALVAFVVRRESAVALVRRSPTLRVLAAILVLSLASLYGASTVFLGIASVFTTIMQLAVFVVAASLVRSLSEARRSLLAIAGSLFIPAVYGLYQASLPFGSPVPDWGRLATAYDLFGRPFLRVFSTLDHPLHFSHYMSTGLGVALGLAAGPGRPLGRALLLVTAGLAVAGNMLTYSAGGLLGIIAVLVVIVLALRSRRLVMAVLLVVVVVALVAPGPLVAKIERLFAGDAATTAARLVTYKQALMVLRDHPILGVGWGGMKTAFKGEYRLTRADPVAYVAENYFLYRAIALGLVGLALHVALFVMFFRNLHRLTSVGGRGSESWGLATAMLTASVAFLVQAQLIPAAHVSTNSVLWLLFATAESLRLGAPGGVQARPASAADGRGARA